MMRLAGALGVAAIVLAVSATIFLRAQGPAVQNNAVQHKGITALIDDVNPISRQDHR